MQQRSKSHGSTRALATAALTILAAALSACGGGGGSNSSSGGTPTASVASMSVSASKYYANATVTINGTGLDSTLAVSSAACTGMTLSNTSTSTSATYTCKVDGALTSTVVAKSNGTQVGSAAFTVPAPIVTMTLNNQGAVNGNVLITLAPDKAPVTVDNFLAYVTSGFYNNTIFHRIVPGFVAQGGGYASPVTDLSTATLKSGLLPAIGYENSGLSHTSGTIAMAATSTGAETSQFFFDLANNTNLDGAYTVFGSITSGSDVITAMLAAPANCTTTVVDSAGDTETDCLPNPNVVITSATQTQ